MLMRQTFSVSGWGGIACSARTAAVRIMLVATAPFGVVSRMRANADLWRDTPCGNLRSVPLISVITSASPVAVIVSTGVVVRAIARTVSPCSGSSNISPGRLRSAATRMRIARSPSVARTSTSRWPASPTRRQDGDHRSAPSDFPMIVRAAAIARRISRVPSKVTWSRSAKAFAVVCCSVTSCVSIVLCVPLVGSCCWTQFPGAAGLPYAASYSFCRKLPSLASARTSARPTSLFGVSAPFAMESSVSVSRPSRQAASGP